MTRSEGLPVPGALPAQPTAEVDEVDLVPVRTYWQLVRKRFLQHRMATIALVLMLVLVTSAIVFPIIGGDAWYRTSLTHGPSDPSSLAAPLGYDNLGINIFFRLMKGLYT